MNNNIILECKNLNKSYQDGHIFVDVIQSLNFQVEKGDSIGIFGASGSGKSTLLQLLGGLDSISSGDILINGENIDSMDQTELSLWRNKNLGFIYQFHHLLPEFTALENVMMPLLIAHKNKQEIKDKAETVLSRVGLKNRLNHRPSELSGGERQRAAIARALVTEPQCILADEPTGNLDKKNARIILELMIELKNELNTAFVVVTHDEDLATHFQKTFLMVDGQLEKLK